MKLTLLDYTTWVLLLENVTAPFIFIFLVIIILKQQNTQVVHYHK